MSLNISIKYFVFDYEGDFLYMDNTIYNNLNNTFII